MGLTRLEHAGSDNTADGSIPLFSVLDSLDSYWCGTRAWKARAHGNMG